MAMNTPAKLWVRVSLLVSVGLLVVARRTLEAVPGLAKALTAIAVIAFLGGLGAQIWRWAKATHKRKQAETTLLACFLGLLAAGVMYYLTTKSGLALIGRADATPKSAAKFDTIMTIGWMIVGLCALLPTIFMEATVGEWTADDPDDVVEFQRTREMGISGLTIALAVAFLMVTCNVAKQKNVRKDVSYFKTSSPGESTRKIVDSLKAPIKVLMFFPEVNEVGEEVRGYFQELGRQTGKVQVKH